jgi:anaerobic magnesium-protoporphyrin IX monomethyl ester cyclase
MKDLRETTQQLDQEITAFIGRGVEHHDPALFNHLALRAFELQFYHIPIYRKYCLRRGISPDAISSWEQIPALPTDGFKTALFSLFPSRVSRTFVTSGTSAPEERGKVAYDEAGLGLMDATIRTAASAWLFPDGMKARFLVLVPSPDLAPAMVMAYGMNRLIETFGLPHNRFLIDEKGFDVEALIRELGAAEDQGVPVALCGGSFGFVNFFDYCAGKNLTFQLPKGSRLLDAGGFKGRSRVVGSEEFLDCCERTLGLDRDFCINLLGMTEIASQYYDNTLKNRFRGLHGPRVKAIPPWTRILVVDPDSLEPLPEGQTGLLRHVDLANRGHICAVQTDDLGRIEKGGFLVYGRAMDDGSRGCSLSLDDMTKIL